MCVSVLLVLLLLQVETDEQESADTQLTPPGKIDNDVLSIAHRASVHETCGGSIGRRGGGGK